jgi:hypothetical protein
MVGTALQDVDWKMDPASGEYHTKSKTLPEIFYLDPVLRIRIRDPVPLTPGSWIRNRFFPDPGSQTHIFESLMTIFRIESFIILCKLAQICFFTSSKLIQFSIM